MPKKRAVVDADTDHTLTREEHGLPHAADRGDDGGGVAGLVPFALPENGSVVLLESDDGRVRAAGIGEHAVA